MTWDLVDFFWRCKPASKKKRHILRKSAWLGTCVKCFFLSTVLHETRTNKITHIPSHADSPKSDHFYLLGWHCQQFFSKSQVTLIHWELFSRARSIQTYTVAHNSQVMRYPHTCHYSVDLAHLVNKILLNPKSSWFLEFCFTRHVLFKHTHTLSHKSQVMWMPNIFSILYPLLTS